MHPEGCAYDGGGEKNTDRGSRSGRTEMRCGHGQRTMNEDA
ncbi:hypothetical protein ACODT5_06640 [Streptomyces sp. 5.8]